MTDVLQPGTQISWDISTHYHQIRLIGMGGQLAAGKDTIADHLVEQHGWVKLGMSDPLDKALLAMDPFIKIKPGERLNSTKSSKYLPYTEIRNQSSYVEAKEIENVRVSLQKLGTEVGRNILGENTWVNVADNMIFDLLAEGKSVVLTGVRFPNEIALINKYELGETWYVKRPVKRGAQVAVHASETSVSEKDFSVVIDNNKSLKALYATVDSLLERPNG